MRRITANSVKNVTPFIVSDPIRIDSAVKALQSSFSELTWLEKSFARGVIRSETRTGENDTDINYIFPAIFINKRKDYFDLLLNDNWSAYSFFLSRDSESFFEYQEGIPNTCERELEVYFWMNLEQTDAEFTFSDPESYFESLKQEVIDKIKETKYHPDSNNGQVLGVTITEIVDNPNDVFEGFTLNLTESQYLYYPYRGLRIVLNVSYVEGCS